MREEVQNWLSQAGEDFKAANENFNSKLYYLSAFCSQQAAEKALKALFIHKKKRICKTHDLVKIAEELNAPGDILTCAMRLNPQYVVSRYPDAANGIPARQYNDTITVEYVKSAGEILKWVKDFLK